MDRSPQSDTLAGRKKARAQHQAQLSEHASAALGDYWVCLHGLKYPSSDYIWGVAFACVQRNMDICILVPQTSFADFYKTSLILKSKKNETIVVY